MYSGARVKVLAGIGDSMAVLVRVPSTPSKKLLQSTGSHLGHFPVSQCSKAMEAAVQTPPIPDLAALWDVGGVWRTTAISCCDGKLYVTQLPCQGASDAPCKI